MAENIPENALFVCFGAMSNVGMMTGLASIEAIKEVAPGKAGIFCLGAIPTEAPSVLEKTRKVERIITIDGCSLNCAKKIIENAGFKPTKTLNLVTDVGISKKPSSQYDPKDMRIAVDAIVQAINS